MQYANLFDLGKAAIEGDCSQYSEDKEHPDTCIDVMIDHSERVVGTSNPINTVLQSILTSYPPNDMTCTIKEKGRIRTTNCLDKILDADRSE